MGRLITASLPWLNVPRRYLVYLPTGWRSAARWPAVFVFHGGGSDADGIRYQSRLEAVAEENNFVAIFPDGFALSPTSQVRTWNALTCCGQAQAAKVNDVRFTEFLVDETTRRFSLSRGRLYATGFSNGAMLVHLLGVRLPDTFAAIAPVSGDLGVLTLPHPSVPVPILYFAGENDEHIPYKGGIGPAARDRVKHNAVPEVVAWWVGANKAPDGPRTMRGQGFIRSEYDPTSRGPSGAKVVLYSLLNGGHQWPGGMPVPGLGQLVPQVDASRLMWNFFRQYHR